MTNFFDHQERARSRTGALVFYFMLAVVGVVLCIYLALAAIFFQGERWWSFNLFWGSSVIVLGIMAVGVAIKFRELSKGGSAIAEMLRGRLVQRRSDRPEEARLLNVVEEMAIASGVPVPAVYLLDRESSINAFAAGYSLNDAVIGVTAGCVERLTREELQGVIAHEFSHILNGDMALNLRLTGWISGLVGVAVVGRSIIELVAEGADGGGDEAGCLFVLAAFAVGFVFLAFGWIGVLFGRLIQAAISRQREFLADASAVQFTRNPDGLAGALKKIASGSSWLKNAHTEEASHFLFGDGIKGRWTDAFSTHPPILERLHRLKAVERRVAGDEYPTGTRTAEVATISGLAGTATGLAAPPPLPTAEAMLQIGGLDEQHVAYARELLEDLPAALREAVTELLPAQALVCALALSPDASVRAAQLEFIRPAEGAVLEELRRLLPSVDRLDPRLRLPLAELSVSTLHQLSAGQFQRLRQTLNGLVAVDGRVELFEFALERVVIHRLSRYFSPRAGTGPRKLTLESTREECRVLLSALAHLSHRDSEQVARAFAAGMKHLGLPAKLAMAPIEECGVADIDTVLTRLAETGFRARQRLVAACAEAVAADGVVQLAEAELFRAICGSLDVPCPPLL